MNERVKKLRKEVLKLNQDEFGLNIGMSRSNIANIESGRINLTDRNVRDICTTYNVNEEWLRTGDGSMFIEMDREDELAQWAGTLARPDNDNDFMKRFVHMLSKLDTDDWKLLEKMALMMSEDNKKD